SEGAHSFNVVSVDTAGNQSVPAVFSWSIDLTPPTVQITAHPANPANSSDASFGFTGADDKGPVSFLCQLDGGAAVACTSPQASSGLGEGTLSFTVIAVDTAGNQSVPALFSWSIDLTPPTVQITAHPVNPTNSVNASFAFAGSDSAGAVTYLCQLDGAAQV